MEERSIMDKLSQVGDTMFERNIAIIASRRQEVQIFSDGFVYEGFLCGMDDNWVQLYGHEENDKNNVDTQWRFLLLVKNNISAIGPTGRNLSDIDEETRKWIEKKIQIFSDVCDKFLSLRGIKNGREKV
jgi:hypothetical protein